MIKEVSIVMYHYVRDMDRTRFPSIHGRTIKEFRFQLEYLMKTKTLITAKQLIDAVVREEDLPRNSALITFDDGYIDHYTNVMPILHDLKLEGLFFPAAQPINESQVLDTNKIHFILALERDATKIIELINTWILENQSLYNLPSLDFLWKSFAYPSEYDTSIVRYIKLVLQRGLPKNARNALVDILFKRYVTSDEAAFSAELYMSKEQILMMHQCGQYFGSHGYTHEWFDLLGVAGQELEIINSLSFLSSLGIPITDWIMCYPYGCYPYNAIDDNLRSLLTHHNCALGLTDHGGVANLTDSDKFMLSRIDTNELPTY